MTPARATEPSRGIPLGLILAGIVLGQALVIGLVLWLLFPGLFVRGS